MVKVRELLAQGAIGEVRMINADFGFRTELNPKGRLFDLALGGGALLDVGIYPISLASMIFGDADADRLGGAHRRNRRRRAERAASSAIRRGRLLCLSSATRTLRPMEALIMGTEGMIRIDSRLVATAGVHAQR